MCLKEYPNRAIANLRFLHACKSLIAPIWRAPVLSCAGPFRQMSLPSDLKGVE
jgi:hypothetical protein